MDTLLNKRRFHPKWLEYGLVDQSFLNQESAQNDIDDENGEHSRYAAFCRVLESTSTLDDVTIDRYVELAKLDQDQVMAEAALGKLISFQGLTEEQLGRMKTHPAFATAALQSIVNRTQLLRELDSSDVSDDLFGRCISFGKDEVQRKLLGKSGISQQQLAILKDQGASRAVRNLAKDRLRRRK